MTGNVLNTDYTFADPLRRSHRERSVKDDDDLNPKLTNFPRHRVPNGRKYLGFAPARHITHKEQMSGVPPFALISLGMIKTGAV